MQPWHTPSLIWNQSVVPCPVLTVDSWPAYRFLRRQVSWSDIPICLRIFQFVVIHAVKGFGVVNKAEVDTFLELCCFFDDPTDVGNLISGSSTFSKFSLNIWTFMVHVLLKPGLENFEHYFASMWNECNCDGIPVELFQILKDDAVKVLHSICQQIWKTQQGPQDWKRSVFIPIPKKGNARECLNYCKESDKTEWLHWTELEHSLVFPNTLGAYLEPGPRGPNWHFLPGKP